MATSASQVAPPSLSWSVATELPLLHINNNNDNNNIDYNPIRSLSERSLHSGQSTQYKRLICKTGYMLEILPNGVVQGSQKRTNFGILEMITTAVLLENILMPNGLRDRKISLRGRETGLWLCMNSTGQLYAKEHKSDECEFFYRTLGSFWSVYYSVKYPLNDEGNRKKIEWYIALDKKTGKSRRAWTRMETKMSQFFAKTDTEEYKPSVSTTITPTTLLKERDGSRRTPARSYDPSRRLNSGHISGARYTRPERRPKSDIDKADRSLEFRIDSFESLLENSLSIENLTSIRHPKGKRKPRRRKNKNRSRKVYKWSANERL